MSKNKKISQKEFIFQYYKNNPNRDIEHQEIVPAVTKAWEIKYGKTLADPDRAIRTLFEEGKLKKIKKGVYRYDPDFVEISQESTFPENLKKEIFARDNYQCVICGQGRKEGLEIHADHIKPRSQAGLNTVENGQTLCSRHNMFKKNLQQTETGKKMFIRLYELAKQEQDEQLKEFTQ
jgi:5-methylcytosine-specific restriction endonuclease McrA